MEWIFALCSIMVVNIVLSGDNAVVIAMVSRGLPQKQQRLAIMWGSAGAIVLRIVLTLVAAMLLQIPYVQFVGGLTLIWIAAKLLLNGEEEKNVDTCDSLKAAIKTIIIADLIMSLDNTLAIAAVANGHLMLLIAGLVLSIPVIICGSQLLAAVMDRFPFIVYLGAGLIAWTAGEMIVSDHHFGPIIESYVVEWLVPAVITLAVVGLGVVKNFYKVPVKEEEKQGAE